MEKENKLNQWCVDVADRTFTMSGTKIAQKERNALKREFIAVLVDYLKEQLGQDLVMVGETQKGVGIAIDNEKIGFIPIEIIPTFKDTDTDMTDLFDDFVEHKAEMEQKRQDKEKAKAEKIRKQKEIKALKEKAKALAESQPDPQDTPEEDVDDLE